MSRGIFIKTFGCQMNEYDSERLETQAAQLGYFPVESETGAGVVVINTCSIREKAESKLMGYLGRLKKMKQKDPELQIIVSGCVAQQEGEDLARRTPYVDLILGTDQVDEFDTYLVRLRDEPRTQRKTLTATAFLNRKEAYRPNTYPTGRKPFVSIMKGCDKMCTYCIVPFTRGREKSRPKEEVIREVRYLVGKGHKEITLIGQNVNSYGKDLGKLQFAELLYAVAEVDGLQRLRFTTSHPIDLADDLVQAFRDIDKLGSHFHLPVQSGSDAVLQAMHREYSVSFYLERLAALREARPDIAITTDIIVGFPTETEADFQATLDLVEKVRYDSAYSFAYSPRPHTRAIRMEDTVPNIEKKRRLHILQARMNAISEEKNQRWVGRTLPAYVEGVSRDNPERWSARTSHNKLIHFSVDQHSLPAVHTYIQAEITRARATNFDGTLLPTPWPASGVKHELLSCIGLQ